MAMAEEAEAPAATVGEEDARLAAGEAAAEDFGLPAELMAVLPDDPFAQLDVARKITSIALASRLGRLEAEAARLRAQLAERDSEAEDLRERVEQLDAALAVATGRLRRAEEEKETLLSEKASLSNTVRKLNRDVAKLEVFKKTLVQSLQEDEDNPNAAPRARVTETSNFSSATSVTDEDSAFPAYKSSQFSETASSVSDESGHVDQVPRPPRPQVFLPSYNSTPRITPSDSPPRRHSISVTSMNMFNDRSSVFSGHHSSPFDAASQTDIFGFGGTLHFGRRTNRKRTPGLYWFRPPMWALGKGIMPSREERKLEPPWMTDRLQAMIERVHHLRDKGLTTTNVVEIFIRWRLIPLCCRSSLAFTYSGFMDENMVSSAECLESEVKERLKDMLETSHLLDWNADIQPFELEHPSPAGMNPEAIADEPQEAVILLDEDMDDMDNNPHAAEQENDNVAHRSGEGTEKLVGAHA